MGISVPVELDYLAIGHVTRDLADGGSTVGGTVSYASRTARALGLRVGVVTSAGPCLEVEQHLDGISMVRLPSSATTTFENSYTSSGRHQILRSVAEPLGPEAVLSVGWGASIVHLGPVARECDPALVHLFDDSFIGVTPQGWMRCWDQAGNVASCQWESAEQCLARANAVVLSKDDVAGDEALIAQYAAQTQVLVVTAGAAGCIVYAGGKSRSFSPPRKREADPTGAGDIFAAVFFVSLHRGVDPWDAARLANCVAAQSVTRSGLAGTPTAEEIAGCQGKVGTS